MKLLISGGCRQTIVNIAKMYPALWKYMGWMNSPRHMYSIDTLLKIGCESICLDNAAYSNFSEEHYLKMLDRWLTPVIPVEWVTVPDVVSDAKATYSLFEKWYDRISLPRAFVAQDGSEDLELPWDHFKTLFIGGSTDWKLSRAAEDVAREAKHRGKVLHMGRVNSQKRLRYAYQLGCDSVDGTGYSKYNKKELLKALQYVEVLHRQQFFEWG